MAAYAHPYAYSTPPFPRIEKINDSATILRHLTAMDNKLTHLNSLYANLFYHVVMQNPKQNNSTSQLCTNCRNGIHTDKVALPEHHNIGVKTGEACAWPPLPPTYAKATTSNPRAEGFRSAALHNPASQHHTMMDSRSRAEGVWRTAPTTTKQQPPSVHKERVEDVWHQAPRNHLGPSFPTQDTRQNPNFQHVNQFNVLATKNDTIVNTAITDNQNDEITFSSNITVVRGNLFSAPAGYALVHCVAADFHCSRGIAPEVVKRYGNIEAMKAQLRRPGQVAIDQRKSQDRPFILHMVTKELSTDVPTHEKIVESLCELRNVCQLLDIKKIAMPKIACGKDRQKWKNISREIQSIFGESNIEVLIYFATRADIKKIKTESQQKQQNQPKIHSVNSTTVPTMPKKKIVDTASQTESSVLIEHLVVAEDNFPVVATGKTREELDTVLVESARTSPVQQQSPDQHNSGPVEKPIPCNSPELLSELETIPKKLWEDSDKESQDSFSTHHSDSEYISNKSYNFSQSVSDSDSDDDTSVFHGFTPKQSELAIKNNKPLSPILKYIIDLHVDDPQSF